MYLILEILNCLQQSDICFLNGALNGRGMQIYLAYTELEQRFVLHMPSREIGWPHFPVPLRSMRGLRATRISSASPVKIFTGPSLRTARLPVKRSNSIERD